MSNMELWNAVSKTDPDHTKRVNQRGGFTAIDAHYQVMLATQQFGPVGVGWGYEAGAPIFHQNFIIVPVTMWHGSRENVFGPVYGCAEIAGNRPDADAPKKAGTDALTKLLSQLGFNADVFLGRFDDSKYVEHLRQEKEQKEQAEATQNEVQAAIDGINQCGTIDALKTFYIKLRENMTHVAAHADVVQAKDVRKAELEQK